MLYQEYKQRLENYLNVFGRLWRFRYLILLILILIITLMGVLLGITGNVFRVNCPDTIEYGSEYEPEGRAIFRKATVQYRAENAMEWVEDRPVLVGTYEVRAVSRGIFGETKTGSTSFFQIVPKPAEVQVAEGSFLYGELPSATVDLAYRDSFEGESFEYEWQDADRCTVIPHVERILSERGDDVTDCYSLVSVPREVSVFPRPVTIVTADATKVYDGEPLLAEVYELAEGTIASGETLNVSFPNSLVSVGECENVPVCTVYSADGEDVTEHYAFTVRAGTLEMTPRPVTIVTADATKIYDGEPLLAEEYELTEGTIVSGEKLDVSFPDFLVSVGEYGNVPVCTVHAASGEDVTENYTLTICVGTLKILPRPITVKTASHTWIYDGEPHCLDGEGQYEVEGLVEKHRTFVRDSVELTEITDTEEEVRYWDNVISIGILDEEGNDVTQNYEIAYEYGKLRIKTKIFLTVYSLQKIYDGTPLMFEDGDFYAVKPPDVSVDLDLTGFSLTDAGALSLRSVFDAPVSVTDSVTGLDVRAENLWEFVGDADEPILTVERRKLEITSNSISTARNGKTLNGWEGPHAAWISFGTLAKGHTIEIEVTGTLSPSSDVSENTISSVKILDALSVDVTGNYEIVLRPGVLKWIS